MKQTINFYQFRDVFKSIRPDNFSYEGLQLLFEHLENIEEDTGEEIEFDVIAICCDYSEDTIDDIVEQYDIDVPGYLEAEEIDEYISEQLKKKTIVIGVTSKNTIVYSVY